LAETVVARDRRDIWLSAYETTEVDYYILGGPVFVRMRLFPTQTNNGIDLGLDDCLECFVPNKLNNFVVKPESYLTDEFF
jgi:hypothetical protein